MPEVLDDPVDVVRSPVVDGAPGDRLLGVPGPARVLEPSDERLDVEDVTKVAAIEDAADRQPVGVPPAALVHGDRAVDLARQCDQRVGIGGRQAHRLLDDDVLAGPQQVARQVGVVDGRRGDDGDVDGVVGGERVGRRVRVQIREVEPCGVESVGDRIGRGDEREPVGLGRREPVEVAHPAVRAVADDADAERSGRRPDGDGAQQPLDEPTERGVRLQRVDVGHAGRDHHPVADAPDGEGRQVVETDAGRRHHVGVGVGGGERSQSGDDRDLAGEARRLGPIGERDEPLGVRVTADVGDAAETLRLGIVGFGDEDDAGAATGSVEVPVDVVGAEAAGHDSSHVGGGVRRVVHGVERGRGWAMGVPTTLSGPVGWGIDVAQVGSREIRSTTRLGAISLHVACSR